MTYLRAVPMRRVRSVAVGAMLLLFAVQLLRVAWLYSATWDEAHHLFDGYTVWTRHDHRLNPEVPPLVKLTAALPLLPMHLYAPPNQGRSEPKEAFLDGRAFMVGNGVNRTLLPGRLMCLLWTMGLAWLVYVAARAMFGTRAALCALLLFTFDPNVLANGTLITTDLGSAFCLFGAVYAWYRYGARPGWGRLVVVAAVVGLTLVVKFTGILVLPMLLLLAVADGLRRRSGEVLGRRLAAWAGVVLAGWVVVWAFYGFRYAAAPAGLELKPQLGAYLASLPNPGDAAKLGLLARYRLLPEAYLWGLANTKLTEAEYVSYFFGKIYRHGPWQYFPAAFLIKSTLPFLLLLACFALLWRSAGAGRGRELTFLLVPVAVYFAVVTSSHFDIGARHLLPIYPFLYVIAGAGGAALSRRGRWGMGVAAALLAWQVVTTVRVAPAYMAYGNEAWGGPTEVHRYLSDANVDWGQQLNAVRVYLAANHITNCWFAYFPDGAVQPEDFGVHCQRLPTPSGLFWLGLPMEVPPVIDGTVLISDSDLEGVESGDESLNPYQAFRGMRPTTVIQGGVDVYQGRFAVPLASALVMTRQSQTMAAAGDASGALAVAREATKLAPESGIVELNLADRLAAAGNWKEAVAHYQAAQRLVQAVRPDLQVDEMMPGITKGLAEAERGMAASGAR